MAASDEIIWQVINQQFCSYKLKLPSKTQNFCRNEYNLTGFCSRQSCPLANSRYATVRPDPDSSSLCLFIKTPERTHLPSQWWEKIVLPNNFEKALAVIDDRLQYWPKFYVHRCKQRLTRLTTVKIRERRIAKEEERLGEKLVPKLASKVRRREETRERKAESAAKVERAIERELIERLRSGAYGENPLNVEEGVWQKVLRGLERAEKGEVEEDELEEEVEQEVEYVSDLEASDAEDMEEFDDWLGDESEDEATEDSDEDEGSDDSENDDDDEKDEQPDSGTKRKRPAPAQKPPKPQKKRPRVEIEYEMEPPLKEAQLAF